MKRIAQVIAVLYFIAMTVAVTFPGIAPFNTIEPYVLGLPFVLFWTLSWVVGALAVFFLLYKADQS